MLRLRCPHCGEREEAEFRYRGDATITRPAADAPVEAFADFVIGGRIRRDGTGSGGSMWAAAGRYSRWNANTLTHEVRGVR